MVGHGLSSTSLYPKNLGAITSPLRNLNASLNNDTVNADFCPPGLFNSCNLAESTFGFASAVF
jgi:hypothetical protein